MNYGTSNEIENSAKQVSNVASEAGKAVAKKAIKTAAKSTGPAGVAISAAVEVAEKIHLDKAIKGLVVAFLSLVILMPVLFIVNAGGVSFNIITHVDELIHPGSTDEEELGADDVKSEDYKYAKIITEWMNKEYSELPGMIEHACKTMGVDYEASKDNIVDNTVIPLTMSSSEGYVNTGSVGDRIAAYAKKLCNEGGYVYKPADVDGRCPIENNLTGELKGFNCIGFASACVYHGGGVQTVRCNYEGLGNGGVGYYDSRFSLDKEDLLTAWQNRNGPDWVMIDNGGERNGKNVPSSDLRPGDILEGYNDQGYSYHMIVYVGDSKYIDCSSGNANGIEEHEYIDNGSEHYSRAFRYVGEGSATANEESTSTSNLETYDSVKILDEIKSDTGTRKRLETPSGMSGDTAQSFAVTKKGHFAVAWTKYPIERASSPVALYSSDGSKLNSEVNVDSYHANAMTCNEDGTILVGGLLDAHDHRAIKINEVDRESRDGPRLDLSYAGKEDMPIRFSGMACDKDSGYNILSTGGTVYIYDSSLMERHHVSEKHGGYYQDIGAAGGLVFVCHSITKGNDAAGSGDNYIDIYRESDGEYCGSYHLDYGELESIEIINGEMVLLVHMKGTGDNYIQWTGITALSESITRISAEGAMGSRDVVTVISAFSTYEAQLLPLEEDMELSEDAGWFTILGRTLRDKYHRDIKLPHTLESTLRRASRIRQDTQVPTLFEITIAEPEEIDGKMVSPLIEINPAGARTLCKLFHMDPDAPYDTEAPESTDGYRESGERYEIGDTNIETAIETNADTHLEVLYEDLNGAVLSGRLALPIKKLLTTIQLSKKFSEDKTGIECKLSKKENVHASERGMVNKVVEGDEKYGNYVEIEGKYRIIYAHLDTIEVKQGEMVSKNKKIGTIGANNKTFRLEVYEEGTAIDPEPLFIHLTKFGEILGGSAQIGVVNGRRRSAPESGNRYYQAPANNFPRNWEAGHGGNCTWYAWGRFQEAQGRVLSPSPGGDAFSWQYTDAYEKGKQPRVGAIIVWDYGTGANGHVAFVEEVKPNGDIETTESGWGSSGGGYLFKEDSYTAASGYSGFGTFKCFIYPKYPVSSSSSANVESGTKGTYQNYAYSQFASYGWGESELSALIELWNRESGWNPRASNPTSGAHGIPQALPGSKMASEGSDWRTNPETQIRWGLRYIKERYGTPSEALAFHNRNNWY